RSRQPQSALRAIGRGVEALKRAADTSQVHLRARDESGFGMLELLMAMVMLNVGILAVVGAFSSGNVALARASRISTAAALADKLARTYARVTSTFDPSTGQCTTPPC